MGAVTPGPGQASGGWGLNIGHFIEAHPDWLIRGRAGGLGWSAQRRDSRGVPRGRLLAARTLDELAALIEAAGQASGDAAAGGPG